VSLEIIKIDPSRARKLPEDESVLGFGKFFSNHIFSMAYTREKGWHEAKIEPYRNLELDPASLVFHYSQEIFDGLKAFRGKDDDIYIFRPQDYLGRLNNSARRVCIPEIDVDFVVSALVKLVDLDKDWVPHSPGTSLYIRPVIIATEASLGVKVSSRYLMYIITCPVGAFYVKEMDPIKIAVTDKYVRAVKGSVGEAKTGGNYAASLLAAEEAKKNGYSQVLWLDALERKYLEEVGTMNIFFVVDGALWTPSLSGSILPGVTRDTILKIAQDWNLKVEERRISIDEILAANDNGSLTECFGTGTAVSIAPVSEFKYMEKTISIGNGQAGPVAKRLYSHLQQIQRGTQPDRYGWSLKVTQ
jgi:branched-chain amino acid aminotransferase